MQFNCFIISTTLFQIYINANDPNKRTKRKKLFSKKINLNSATFYKQFNFVLNQHYQAKKKRNSPYNKKATTR